MNPTSVCLLLQVALAGIALIGAIIFIIMLVAQHFYPSKLEIHNELEGKTGPYFLSAAQALSAFAYILCSFYIYSRDSMIRIGAGVSTLIAASLWAFAFYQHSVTRWIYLAIPVANVAFYVLCWYADKDTQFIFDETAQLRSLTYRYKKL